MTKPTIRSLPPEKLILNPVIRISFPASDEDRAASLLRRFPALPLVIADMDLQVVFGECLIKHALIHGEPAISLIQGDFPLPEALFLGFNLSASLFSMNLYEKIRFAHLSLQYASIEEIRKATGLDLPLNAEVTAKLPILVQDDFMPILRDGRVSLKTALEISEIPAEGRPPLFSLFKEIHFSSSQGLLAIEMIREVMNRDHSAPEEILEECDLSVQREKERPAQAILSKLQALRYPLSVKAEEAWQQELKEIGVPGDVQATHAPFFEKKGVELRWKLADTEALRRLARQMQWDKKKS